MKLTALFVMLMAVLGLFLGAGDAAPQPAKINWNALKKTGKTLNEVTATYALSLCTMTWIRREIAAADRLHEDTAVLRPSWADLHRMLHRVLRAIYAVETPGRFLPPYATQEPPETTVSGEDLRQAEGEDDVAPLNPLFKDRFTVAIVACPALGCDNRTPIAGINKSIHGFMTANFASGLTNYASLGRLKSKMVDEILPTHRHDCLQVKCHTLSSFGFR